MTEQFRELIYKGKLLLREYLEDQGVEIIRKGSLEYFSCIDPDHEDSNPSAGFVNGTDESQFHCFSCGFKGFGLVCVGF